MKTLGIEIKGSDCICILISGDKNNFTLETFPKKIGISDSYNSEEIKSFFNELNTLMTSEGLNCIAVKKRNEKGKFAGGPLSFKMEGLIQLASDCEVTFYSGAQINAMIKSLETDTVSLNKYQMQAYFTAVKCLHDKS